MAGEGRKRQILRVLGIVFGGLLLLVLALPLWLPWVLHPLAQRFGIHYAKYERTGYARFALVDVTWSSSGTQFRAGRVEAFVPTVWLWQRSFGREPTTYVRGANWALELSGNKNGRTASAVSLFTNVNQIASTFASLRSWVPKAVLTNGSIRVSATAAQLQLPAATWAKGVLSATVELPSYNQRATVQARVGIAPYEIFLDSDSLHLRSRISLTRSADGLGLQMTNLWLSNRVEVSADFGRSGTLPKQAIVRADSFKIPAALLQLNNFEDLTGSLSLHWQQNQFACDLAAIARPAGPTNLPAIDIQIHSTGNTESAFIETAKISSPWLLVQLSPGIEIKYARPFLQQEPILKLSMDLSRQPWFAAEGKVDGEIRFRPAQDRFPAASFAFSGAGVGLSDFFLRGRGARGGSRDGRPTLQTKSLALSGQFLWPWLEISRMRIDFVDGSTASLSGKLQGKQRIVSDGNFHFEGQFGRQFLPAGYSFDRGSLDVSLSGPLQKVFHSGKLTIENFISPTLNPLQLRAAWAGDGINLQRSELRVSAGKSSLQFKGSLGTTNTETSLLLTTLSLQQDDRALMELETPCRISLSRPTQTNAAVRTWSLQIEPFRWQGVAGRIALEAQVGWPVYGHVAGLARLPDLAALTNFAKGSPGGLKVEELNFSADWRDGPANLALELAASVNQQGIPFSARAGLKGDAKGISVQRLAIASQAQPVFAAHGFLPINLTPSQPKHWVHFLSDQPLQLQVMTQTNSLFWDEIAAATGMVLLAPDLNASVSGTWESPQGRVDMNVKQIKLAVAPASAVGRAFRLPASGTPAQLAPGLRALTVEDFRLALELDRETAHVKNLSVMIAGQPAVLTADMPLGKKFWAGLETGKPSLDWEAIAGRLKIENAQIAAVTRLMPRVLSPDGRLNLDLALRPGGKLEGELSVTGASTRPLASFGTIRDIALRMKFIDRKIELNPITASIGGAPLSVSGSVDLRGTEWLKGVPPPFQLKVQGTNLPLARHPGFVLRSDISANIAKTQNAPALITGVVRLRDSFYLRDLKDLVVPGGVATAGSRPPYFSIDVEPLADWRLNLDLKGDRCLKVNSPLFHGVVSSDLKLTGTLKDPIALGNVKINSGQVQFPFANLDVTQGFVTLTSENPYQPQLLVSAAARRAGYDVKMELSGPATQPVIQFSSTPPLTPEQIVLMLTAGELPKSEYTLSTQQKAQTLALYVGKNLLTQFGLGGGGERLSIQTGQDISETGALTYHVEYKLSDRWYLVGEYDRFNAFNVGLKWRVYSK